MVTVAAPDLTGLKILVIDDSLSAIQKATTVLEAAGHTVETLELLIYLPQKVKESPPDLILLDLSMPALSGVNVARFVRRYESRPIPLVLYSSRTEEELAKIADDLGAAGFFQKGQPDSALTQVVANSLRSGAPAGT